MLPCSPRVRSGLLPRIPGSFIILNLGLILGWGVSNLAFNAQGVPIRVRVFHPPACKASARGSVSAWLLPSSSSQPAMLVGIMACSLAFGGPNVGKRPLMRQATPRMLLPDVSLSQLDRINKRLDRIDDKLDALDAQVNMLTASVAAIGTIVGLVVAVGVVATGVHLEKSAAKVLARAQVPVSRESAPLQVEAPSTSKTIAVASPFPARD